MTDTTHSSTPSAAPSGTLLALLQFIADDYLPAV